MRHWKRPDPSRIEAETKAGCPQCSVKVCNRKVPKTFKSSHKLSSTTLPGAVVARTHADANHFCTFLRSPETCEEMVADLQGVQDEPLPKSVARVPDACVVTSGL